MRWSRIIFSFAFSLLFLYLTFFVPRISDLMGGSAGIAEALFGHLRFDLAHLGNVLKTANWIPIGVAAIFFFASLVLRAWRWQVMLTPVVNISFNGVFSAMCIGYMANNVLPLRMGELYRAHVVYRISGLSRSTAFGSVVLERVTDLLFMMPYLILTVFIFPLPGWLKNGAFAAAASATILAVFMIWLAMDRDRAMHVTRQMLSVLPGKIGTAIASLIERFTSGFEVIRRSENHVGLIVSSLSLWAMYAAMAYCVLLSVGFMNSGINAIEQNPVGAVLVTLMITTLGFVIPGAPGGVGTYHGLTVLGLSLFNVPGDRAAGFAILLHALNYVPLTVLGLVFFWKLGLSFHDTNCAAAEMKSVSHPSADASVADENRKVNEVGK